MTTVYISPKGKKFLKKKYSAKVAEYLVNNSAKLRSSGSVNISIGGKDFIFTSSDSVAIK